MRVYYSPPETFDDPETGETKPFPPFEYEYSSRTRRFESPHQYFKKVEETYDVGVLTNPNTGKPRLDSKGQPVIYKGKRERWEPDTVKNAKMKAGVLPRPQAHLDLNRAELEFLRSARYSFFTPYLVQEAQLENSQRNDLEKRKAAHYAEMEALEQALEAQKAALADAVDEAKRRKIELQQLLKAPAPAPAPTPSAKKGAQG